MKLRYETELYHYGTPKMRWHHRLYQNKDGSLTPLGKARYSKAGLTAAGAVRLAGNYGRIAKDEYVAPGMRQARKDIRAFRNGGMMGVRAQRAFDRSFPQMYRKSRQTPGRERMMSRSEIQDLNKHFYDNYRKGYVQGIGDNMVDISKVRTRNGGQGYMSDRVQLKDYDQGMRRDMQFVSEAKGNRMGYRSTIDDDPRNTVERYGLHKEASQYQRSDPMYKSAKMTAGKDVGYKKGAQHEKLTRSDHITELTDSKGNSHLVTNGFAAGYRANQQRRAEERHRQAAKNWEKEHPGMVRDGFTYEDYLEDQRRRNR